MKIKKNYTTRDSNMSRKVKEDFMYALSLMKEDQRTELAIQFSSFDEDVTGIRNFIHGPIIELLSYIWFKKQDPDRATMQAVKNQIKELINFPCSFSVLEYDKDAYLEVLESIRRVCFEEQGYVFPIKEDYESLVERAGKKEAGALFIKSYLLRHDVS